MCLYVGGRHETRTFATMTRDLLGLADWLGKHRVTHGAMESTSAYWKPIYNPLESYDFELILVNPHEFKAVPGRKTDVKGAEWLADLLRHGLLKASFAPERAHREPRELVRYRKSLVEERTRELNRIEKGLAGANIKLSAVASTVAGKGVRDMLRGLAAGETAASDLADLARGRMRSKKPELARALRGTMGPHQRFMLGEQVSHLEEVEARIDRVSHEIEERLRPIEEALERLEPIPGMGRKLAEAVVSEIGLDMSRFPSAAHLASWAKTCPGNNERAGKRKTGRTGPGNRHLRAALVEAAHAAARKRDGYLPAQYHRIASRRSHPGAGRSGPHPGAGRSGRRWRSDTRSW